MPIDADVEVHIGQLSLAGHMSLPPGSLGLVIFAHGSGSSRHSPRNRFVAEVLNDASLGTLLFDLLTPDEERDRRNVFDISMLGRRLRGVTEWARAEDLPIAYFGASTGAGAALVAAADEQGITAVVSRGGRPDLAGPYLPAVEAPTLLIVGGHDHVVEDLNRQAMAEMTCERRLEIIPGASHLFEEGDTLAQAAALARDWFLAHLGS